MNKIYIKLIFCLLFAGSINAQTTGVKFAPDGTRWSTEYDFCTSMTNCPYGWQNYQIRGDTVINNKFCQKIDTNNYHNYDTTCMEYNGFYLYYNNKQLYLNTFLLYDFNLNAGDTFDIYVYAGICSHNGYYKMPVDFVDSMYYGNMWRKKITFKQMPGFRFGPVRWVEGIGDIDHGFNFALPPTYGGIYGAIEYCYCLTGFVRLNCFQEPGYAAYGNYCYNGSCTTGINEMDDGSNIFIYPNPATDKIYIERTNNDAMDVSLFDIIGKQVSETQKSKSKQTEIDVSGLREGVYFVKIKTSEGMLTRKIVVVK